MTKHKIRKLPSVLRIQSTGLDERYDCKNSIALNYAVVRLVLFGFSNTAIANKTGLTYCQVQNRIKMYKLQGARSMFRMGETEEAKKVMEIALRVSPEKRNQDKAVYNNIRNSILDAYKKENVCSS